MDNKDKYLMLAALAVSTVLVFNFNAREKIQTTEKIVIEEQTTKIYGTSGTVEELTDKEWVGSVADFHPIECDLDVDVQEFIYYLSASYEIDFQFIMAVIEHESNYQTDVISSTNDYGLMQINKCNHEWLSEALGITDFLDPYQNVQAGIYKFHLLFEKYGDDTAKVLMAYNMGENGAKKLWDRGIVESKYSRAIMGKVGAKNAS